MARYNCRQQRLSPQIDIDNYNILHPRPPNESGEFCCAHFPPFNQKHLASSLNQWKGILLRCSQPLGQKIVMNSFYLRPVNCVRAPPSCWKVNSQCLSNSVEGWTQKNCVCGKAKIVSPLCLPCLLFESAVVIASQCKLWVKGKEPWSEDCIQGREWKGKYYCGIVFRDPLWKSFKDNISSPCQYLYWFYFPPKGLGWICSVIKAPGPHA